MSDVYTCITLALLSRAGHAWETEYVMTCPGMADKVALIFIIGSGDSAASTALFTSLRLMGHPCQLTTRISDNALKP